MAHILLSLLISLLTIFLKISITKMPPSSEVSSSVVEMEMGHVQDLPYTSSAFPVYYAYDVQKVDWLPSRDHVQILLTLHPSIIDQGW